MVKRKRKKERAREEVKGESCKGIRKKWRDTKSECGRGVKGTRMKKKKKRKRKRKKKRKKKERKKEVVNG